MDLSTPQHEYSITLVKADKECALGHIVKINF